ncbi:TasA family protein, partial [Frisingicoccus sp.]|uniref:TasA family protein n=2 Tax=Frisingicoccus sp. TaxID=1918627 RepID=UPI0037358A75
MKKSSMRTLALTAILAGTVSIGGIMAYFTDGDTATNTFTVGKISLDLQEPSWVPPTNITPGQEIAKDPQIKNDGNNEEFVFLKVTVPYANVVTANEDGTKGKTADTELFSYDVKDGWTELLAKKEIDSSLKTVTHLYAYTGDTTDSMKALDVNSSTTSLFDWVRFAN